MNKIKECNLIKVKATGAMGCDGEIIPCENSATLQSLLKVKNLTSCASELRARLDGVNDVVIADVNRRPVKRERVRNRLNVLTTLRKAATQIIRGAAKARFRRTLRAGFADAHAAPYRKFGFTLAEVLVTLAVIGIVAVMTIPNLVQNYQNKAWNTADTVFQRKLTEAMKMMNTQGTLAGYTKTEDFVQELSKHLKITKICDNTNLKACFEEKISMNDKIINISEVKTAKDFGQIHWDTNVVGFQLANGVNGLMAYNPGCKQDQYSNQISGSDCLAIVYDVSGYTSPNTIQKDLRVNGNVIKINGELVCLIKLNGVCYSVPFHPSPLKYAECMELVNSGFIEACYVYASADYWAGTVKTCGGIDNMTSLYDLARLADYIYDVKNTGDSGGSAYVAKNVVKKDFYDSFNNGMKFRIWSSFENSNTIGANYRYFDPNRTYWQDEFRTNSGIFEMCKN